MERREFLARVSIMAMMTLGASTGPAAPSMPLRRDEKFYLPALANLAVSGGVQARSEDREFAERTTRWPVSKGPSPPSSESGSAPWWPGVVSFRTPGGDSRARPSYPR